MSLLATEGIDRNLGVGDEDNGGHSERQDRRRQSGGGRGVVGWRERCFATPMRSLLTNGGVRFYLGQGVRVYRGTSLIRK